MSQRDKEAVATLVYAGLLSVLCLICWHRQSVALFPWVAGPISLAYGLFIAAAHDAAKKRRCAVYDERDAFIEGKAWRAALSGAVTSLGLYVIIIVFHYGRSGDPRQGLTIPLLSLPVGLILVAWAAGVTWALATLYLSRAGGTVDANRQPCA